MDLGISLDLLFCFFLSLETQMTEHQECQRLIMEQTVRRPDCDAGTSTDVLMYELDAALTEFQRENHSLTEQVKGLGEKLVIVTNSESAVEKEKDLLQERLLESDSQIIKSVTDKFFCRPLYPTILIFSREKNGKTKRTVPFCRLNKALESAKQAENVLQTEFVELLDQIARYFLEKFHFFIFFLPIFHFFIFFLPIFHFFIFFLPFFTFLFFFFHFFTFLFFFFEIWRVLWT